MKEERIRASSCGPERWKTPATAVVFALTTLRAILVPVVIFLAERKAPGRAFASCLVIAFVSDIYDGVIARRFEVATPGLRRFDSITDTAFYVAVTYATWLCYPNVIRTNVAGILVIFALEITRYVYDLRKFKREASYHMWSAKLFGIFLFAAFFALFGFGTPKLMPLAIIIGIIAELEGLAASFVLPKWTHDVPTIRHAYAIAKSGRFGSRDQKFTSLVMARFWPPAEHTSGSGVSGANRLPSSKAQRKTVPAL
jgi:phosphatidylglycerophosphate synthase